MTYNPTRRVVAGLFLFCVISLFAPRDSLAAPITVPTDLNAGDKYRLAFVTSTKRDATSSNIADYNNFVTAVANTVPQLLALGTSWRAIGSTVDVDARDNTGTNPTVDTGVPVYRLDDTRIADDNLDLWDGVLLAAFDVTELLTTPAFLAQVYTGSTTSGTAFPDYALGSPTVHAEFGYGSQGLNNGWVQAGIRHNISTETFYAISGELTVVPEPTTMSLGWIGATAVVGWQLRRRRYRRRQ